MGIMKGNRRSYKQAKNRIDRNNRINRSRGSAYSKSQKSHEEPELTSEEIEFLADLLNRARTGVLQ
jgi:hypothetical protein